MSRVVVLGGGFGGVAAANELRTCLNEGDEVVLIDRHDGFAMGFAKLWDLAGTRPIEEGTRSLADLAHRGITVVQAEVTAVDPATLEVSTSAGSFAADALIVALGAPPHPAHRRLLQGPDAHDLYDIQALPAMHQALDAITDGRVVISIFGGPFKCPPAPFEAALIVDRRLRERGVRDNVDVVVTTPMPMTVPVAGVDASRYVADHLEAQGVELRAEQLITDVDTTARQVRFGDDALDFDLLLGVPADSLPEVLQSSGLAGSSGWLEPDPHTLRLPGHQRIYAIGDCTQIPTPSGQLPHAGVFAAAHGRVAARNIAAQLTGSGSARFDGHGYCFLELPDQRVAFVQGNFYADPSDVTLAPADHAQFLHKQAYEHDHLVEWFGA